VDPGQQNLNFSRQISEKFRFFQAISKISIVTGKFLQNFDFFRQIFKKIRFFQANYLNFFTFSGNV